LGVFPTEQQTLAIFVGNQEKCFVIHVEPVVGRAIAMSMRGERSERPLTHELVGLIFQAFDVTLERVVVNDLRSNTYFARIMLKCENEVHSKHVEIDARPSDSIALALQAEAPIYVSDMVWEEVDDRSEELEKIKQALRDKQLGLGGPGGPASDPLFDDDDEDDE